MLRKQLEDGTWIEKVNHLEQSPEENMTDIIAGFFDGNLMNKESLRKVLLEVIDHVETLTETQNTPETQKESKAETGEKEICNIQLSLSFVFMRIAKVISSELGDFELARAVYKRSEELADDVGDYSCLADSVLEHLKDNEWQKELLSKAHSLVKNSADVLALTMNNYQDN